MSASYFSFSGFEFSPNLYCKNSSGKKEQKTQKKKILEAVIVVKTIIFPLVRDSSFQSLYKSLLFQDMQSLLNSIFVMS